MTIVFGGPRSGKTTFLREKLLTSDNSFILKVYEHDNDNLLSDMTLFNNAQLQFDDLCDCVLDLFESYDSVGIDSLSMFAFQGQSLRKGGVNNRLPEYLSTLTKIENINRKKIFVTISPFSGGFDEFSSLLCLLFGCTRNLFVLNSEHEVNKLDYNTFSERHLRSIFSSL